MLAFRIFVMLSCLIVVPMAAIFGSAFPDVVKTVLVDRIVAFTTGKWPEPGSASSPEGFTPVTPATGSSAVGDAPRWGQPAASGAWQDSQTNHHHDPTATAAGVIPAAASQPAGQAGAPDAVRAAPSVYLPQSPDAPRAGASPDHPLATSAFGHAAPGAAPPLDQPERFTAMERKLREYGATYYLLETWGNEGQWYRFHCKMAVGNNPNYTRHFEATDRDALKAMDLVLEKVEQWREGRLQ